MGLTAAGVLVLGSYNLLFVPTFNIGRWYFPISTLFVSLFFVDVLSNMPRVQLAARTQYAALGFASAVTLTLYVTHRHGDNDSKNGRFYYEEAPRVLAHYKGQVPLFVEYDDGILAFSLGARALSGWGLVLDRDAAKFIKRNPSGKPRPGLIDLALKRGYRRAATLTYGAHKLSYGSTDEEIRRSYQHLLGRKARKQRFRVEYLSTDGRFSIVVAEHRLRP